MNTVMAIVFGAAFIGVWIVFGLLMKRDRGTHADETPKTPYQKDDVEAESKRQAR